MISGEGPAGTIGAMHAGRQAHQNDARTRIAEGWHRPAVVLGFLNVNGIQKCGETRTAPAIGVKNGICREGVSHGWAHGKNGLRGPPRVPPSIALGLWTNPSATEPCPVGLEPVRPPRQGKNSTQLANFSCWLSL